jgi:hypothetical protein
MTNGISAAPLPTGFPYKAIIEQVCGTTFFPCLVGAIKMNETGLGQGPTTENVISFDGGHGIMQLTSAWPDDWQDPQANIRFAVEQFMTGSYAVWTSSPYSLSGGDLVRAIAASYNAGYEQALAGHKAGDFDRYTTNQYAARALAHYQQLIQGVIP